MNRKQSKVLWIVLGINAVMFFVEMSAGLLANSLSLTGDSLDMLGDSIAYGSSLYVINKGMREKAWSAFLKGIIMLGTAGIVLGRAIMQFTGEVMPEPRVMGGIGLLALAANATCLFLLTRYRNDDINMSSVWKCSRNDIVANVSVLIAAGLVTQFQSLWPDLIVGLGITALFTKSALGVLAESRQIIRQSA